MHVVRQRLLAVDMLAVVERHHRRRRVGVVGGGDMDGVDPPGELVEHPPKIAELFRARMLLDGGREVARIDIAQGNHLDLRVR